MILQEIEDVLKSSVQMVLANPLDTRVQGALICSWVQNITEMDVPSSFFFGLEKKHGQKKSNPLTAGQIRRRAVEYYSSLYSSEYEENDALIEGFCGKLPQVSAETNSQLDCLSDCLDFG